MAQASYMKFTVLKWCRYWPQNSIQFLQLCTVLGKSFHFFIAEQLKLEPIHFTLWFEQAEDMQATVLAEGILREGKGWMCVVEWQVSEGEIAEVCSLYSLPAFSFPFSLEGQFLVRIYWAGSPLIPCCTGRVNVAAVTSRHWGCSLSRSAIVLSYLMYQRSFIHSLNSVPLLMTFHVALLKVIQD